MGTLIAVYLSTSDEMLPIFISEGVSIWVILKILGIKLLIGMIAGFIINFAIRIKNKGKEEEEKIVDLCEKEHCDCEHGIVKSATKHTVSIFLFILIITSVINLAIYFIGEETIAGFMLNRPILGPMIAGLIGLIPNCASSVLITQIVINLAIYFIGEETIAGFMLNRPILGPMIAGLIGLIPNCASSVLITQMYLENMITAATMISGLLVGAGVGLAVLFKTNKGIKENIKITLLLYGIGVISGIVLQIFNLQIV